jgi:hypothetical protein
MRSNSRDFVSVPRLQKRVGRPAAAPLMAVVMLTCAGAMFAPVRADGIGPLSIAKTGHSFVGGR